MTKAGALGAAGENVAVEWLRAHGFIIMDHNWRQGRYELDVVALRGERVHFVEVKLRRQGGLTTPEQAMTPSKERALLHAANSYIELHCITMDCQIDLVAVDYTPEGFTTVRYVPDAVSIHW